MGNVVVIAGDIKKGMWTFSGQTLTEDKFTAPERINLKTHLLAISSVDETAEKSLGGAAVAGIAGAVLFGPLGALGGMLVGGNKKGVSFAAELSDGRKFLAKADSRIYTRLVAIAFDHGRVDEPVVEKPKRDKSKPPPPWF